MVPKDAFMEESGWSGGLELPVSNIVEAAPDPKASK